LKDNEDIIEPLSDRIEGRTSLHTMYSILLTDELIVLPVKKLVADCCEES
jgi:DNA-directed RNA polymerase subunit beta'